MEEKRFFLDLNLISAKLRPTCIFAPPSVDGTSFSNIEIITITSFTIFSSGWRKAA
jgi:hypothetical protein